MTNERSVLLVDTGLSLVNYQNIHVHEKVKYQCYYQATTQGNLKTIFQFLIVHNVHGG